MTIRARLLGLYETTGYSIVPAGGGALADCMALAKDGRRLDTGSGVSWQEIAVWERLAETYTPRAIFGIGNGFGWSTLALSLIWPRAAIVVLDAETEGGDNREGNELTRRLLGGGMVVRGTSPADVPWGMTCLGAPAELVFVDGTHTDAAQAADFGAVRGFLAPEHVVFFHDVGLMGMGESFGAIAEGYPGRSRILDTPTGMGAVWTAGVEVPWE